MKADKKLMEQIVKTAVNYNGQEVEFDKKFLSLMENYELQVEDRGEDADERRRLDEGHHLMKKRRKVLGNTPD